MRALRVKNLELISMHALTRVKSACDTSRTSVTSRWILAVSLTTDPHTPLELPVIMWTENVIFLKSFLSRFPPLDRGKLGILHFLSKWTKRTKNHPKKSNFTFVILKDMLNTHCETSWIFPFFLYFLFRCRIRHFRPISAPIWGSPKMRGSQPISRPIGSGLEKCARPVRRE